MHLRALAAAAVLMSALFAAGCGARSHDASPQVLRIADLADPDSLNPLLAHDQETIGNDLLVCETLVGLDERNRVVPVLLTRVPSERNGDVSPDGRRITYHLRHGVRFADGVELHSSDVAFTYRAILDTRNSVLSQDAYRRIETLRTPDPYTVVVTLARRWNAAVSDLFSQSDFAFGILPEHAFSDTRLRHAAWEEHAFGTGPFRVAHWYRGDRIILAPNPYFSPKPRLAGIELRMIPDGNTAFVALRTHEVDVAALTTPQMIDQARGISGIRVIRTPENGTEWISIQTLSGAGADPRFRQAVASTLNLGDLHKTYAAYDVAGSMLPPVMRPWYTPLPLHPHDVAAARRWLAGRAVDATLVITVENPLWSRIATAVQQQLGASGIRVTIKKYPTSLFNAPDGPIRNARFTISIDGWLGGADPEQSIVFTCAQATSNGDNISRYCDAQFEKAFADQSRTPSESRRRADFAQMQRLIWHAIPVVPLYYLAWYDGTSARVHNFARNMLQYPVNAQRWERY